MPAGLGIWPSQPGMPAGIGANRVAPEAHGISIWGEPKAIGKWGVSGNRVRLMPLPDSRQETGGFDFPIRNRSRNTWAQLSGSLCVLVD